MQNTKNLCFEIRKYATISGDTMENGSNYILQISIKLAIKKLQTKTL